MARRWWLTAAVAGLALFGPAARGAAAGAVSDEYRVKAVFLFNFAQFVEWPAKVFASPSAPIVIGVLGADPFGSYLDDLVRDEKVGARTLQVRRCRKIEDVDGCHILFVSRSENAALPEILASLRRRSVLTIGDADAFTRFGGMVRFVTEDGKIRLRINLEMARACGLTISSKIVRPGTVVTAERNER